MFEILEKAFTSPAGSFAFILAILLVIFWLIHKATKIIERHSNFGKKVDNMETNIDDIRRDMAYMKGTIETAIGLKDALSKRKSPISLTEAGEHIAKENNFEDIVAQNWSKISQTMQQVKSRNPYDIQEFCMETAFLEPLKFFSERDVDFLKRVAYKSGFSFMSVSRVMGVLIRNAYFKECSINIADVDRHDPSKSKE